jgi:hypothetical protein
MTGARPHLHDAETLIAFRRCCMPVGRRSRPRRSGTAKSRSRGGTPAFIWPERAREVEVKVKFPR